MSEPSAGRQGEAADAEVPAASHVGRVALRVGSLDRVLPFYEAAVGLPARHEDGRAVLGPAADEPLLVLEEHPDAPERPRSAAGLFHLAVRAPDRAALGDCLRRLRDYEAPLSGASDHLVSEALYLRDPEGNGVELYRDRPRDAWPDTADGLAGMQTRPLDLEALEVAGDGAHADALPPGTDVGHVHLEVADLRAAEAFYGGALGLRLRDRYGDSAAFFAAGDYHHHVGLNTWNRRLSPAGEHRGLAWWELVLPDAASRDAAVERLEAAGHAVEEGADDPATRVVRDPDDIALRLVVEG